MKFQSDSNTMKQYHGFCSTMKTLRIDIGRCGVSANETTLHPNKFFKKVNHYRSMYCLQNGAFAHTEQQAIKGPKLLV